MTPKQALQARYLYEQATLAGWGETPNYWRYAVYSPSGEILGYRLKRYPFAPDTVKAKYAWETGKPESLDAQWYILPDTKEAIATAHGVAYMSNGEPAMLAYRAAGFLNALATTLSEIAVPKEAISYLRRMGISRLIYIVDKDAAGLKSAQNWHNALAASGIDLELRQWPSYMADKGDANDALIVAEGKAQAFKILLKDTALLNLTVSEEKKASKPVLLEGDVKAAYSRLALDIFEALSNGSYLTGRKFSSGFYQARCPHHDDHEASAGFHPDSGVLNCFVCGKHGIKENAAVFNLDIASYFPKRESSKKPKKADLSAFQDSLAAIQASITDKTQTYEEMLEEQLNTRLFLHEQKQFVGIGTWKQLPLGALSAVLNLTTGRSSLGLFLGRLHDALIRGLLPSAFTVSQAVEALQLPRAIISRSLFEAEAMYFVSKLRTLIYIDSKASKETVQKGRRAEYWIVELDACEITNHLRKMLEIHYLEKHSRKALSLPNMRMARQMGIDESQYRQWLALATAALNDKDNIRAKQAYEAEMQGNGKQWKGWDNALNSPYAAPLCYWEMETSLDLRASLLKWWVSHVRPQNSREELARLLGCSDPAIDAALEAADLTSVKQNERVEFPAPKTVKAMQFEFNKQQRERRGKVWKISFKVKGMADEWITSDEKTYLKDFAKHAGRITSVFMIIQCPSVQRPMTEAELAKRAEERELAALEAKEAAQSVTEVTVSEDEPKPAKTPSISHYRAPKLGGEYSYTFIYRQLQLLVHCFTPHSLVGHSVIDKKANVLASGKLIDLFAWFGLNASAAPKRKVKSFFGKDYDEEIDLAELQALADAQFAKYGQVDLLPDFEEIEMFDDAQLALL